MTLRTLEKIESDITRTRALLRVVMRDAVGLTAAEVRGIGDRFHAEINDLLNERDRTKLAHASQSPADLIDRIEVQP